MSTQQQFHRYVVRRFPDGEPIEDEWRIICPRCQNPKGRYFINVKTGRTECKHCSLVTTNIWSTIRRIERLKSDQEAQRWLEEHQGEGAFRYRRLDFGPERTLMEQKLPVEAEPIIRHWDLPFNRPFQKYLSKRFNTKISSTWLWSLCQKFDMHICLEGYYRDRIIFPIYDAQQKLIFFVDRSIKENEPKTLGIGTKKEKWPVDKRDIIFNYERVKQCLSTTSDRALNIAEGVISALSISSNFTVALLSKSCTMSQLKKLVALKADRYVLYLDPHTEKERYSLAFKLHHQYGLNVYMVNLDEKIGDPNDYLQKGITLPKPIKFGFQDIILGVSQGWIKVQ